MWQVLNPANDSLGRISCSRRIVFPDVFNSGYKFGPMLRASTGRSSRMEELLDAVDNLLVV